jgi:hypothetical protein
MPRKSGSVGAPWSNPWGDPVQLLALAKLRGAPRGADDTCSRNTWFGVRRTLTDQVLQSRKEAEFTSAI